MIFNDFREVLAAKIAVLKGLGSSNSKIFQALRGPQDPICIARGLENPTFFVPPVSCMNLLKGMLVERFIRCKMLFQGFSFLC